MTRHTKRDVQGMVNLLRLLRWGRPLLKRIGVHLDNLDLKKLSETARELSEKPGVFNRHFADRGWISYDWLNTDASRAAIQAAEDGRLDDGERILAEAYTEAAVRLWLNHMGNLRCFKKRVQLARLAADDYAAHRYHACVPVVLSLLDGMGQELTGAGFLRQGARFVDDDSFLEIGPGLSRLVRVLTRSRGGTTTEPLTVPYRHGILHGVDLNYANHLVAAKAWAALFAAGCYARNVEEAQAPKPEQAGLLETVRSWAETSTRHERFRGYLDAWSPRDQNDVQGGLRNPRPGTPEGAVVHFMEAWHRKNFRALAQTCLDSRDKHIDALAGQIRKNIPEPPVHFVLNAVRDEVPAAATVELTLSWPDFTDSISVRLLYYDDKGLVPSNSHAGRWLLANLWPFEGLRVAMLASKGER